MTLKLVENDKIALKWLEKQQYLRILVGKNGQITMTDGQTVEVTDQGIVKTFEKLQKTLRKMNAN